MNYQNAIDQLGNRKSRKVTHNTYLEPREGDAVALVFHGTDIVTYYPDGSVRLNTGGYETSTTKARINYYAPVMLFQEKRIWYVRNAGKNVPFHDGMRLDCMGNIL